MKTIILSLLGLLLMPIANGQTAVCQNVNVYLDAAGNATITGADIDGGSTDDAATGTLTLTASQTSFSCNDLPPASAPGLMITGTFDGPLPGGHPKGVELLVTGDISDLSMFGIGSANNGGGTDGEELTFPGGAYTTGTYIYVTSDSTQFSNFFGFSADFFSSSMLINGDDAVELFQGGVVIDVFGDINTDGSGQPWDFLDGWAYRNDFETANGGTFNDANWSYSGINVFDGQTTNATSPTPFPFGIFSAATVGAIPVTLIVEDGNLDQDSCVAFVTVFDTISPSAICQDVSVYLDASGLALISEADIDDASSDNCGIALMSTDIQTFTCSEIGANPVTLTVLDNIGNSSSCLSMVTIIDTISPIADCQDFTISLDGSGLALLDPSDVNAASMDNCGIASMMTSIQTFTCTEIGTNNVDLTVFDNEGNSSVCTSTVTVIDTISPVAVCQDFTVALDGSGLALLAPSDIDGGSTDNCGIASMMTSIQTFTCGEIGANSVDLTVLDATGNSSTCSATVTVTGPTLDLTTSLSGATITANATGVAYQWIDCSDNSVISGEMSNQYTATANGDYAVIITDGCSDTSQCVNINTIGLNENGLNIGLNIFPNPSKGVLILSTEEFVAGTIRVTDVKGNIVVTQTLNGNQSIIDLSESANGVYNIELQTPTSVYRRRIVKK